MKSRLRQFAGRIKRRALTDLFDEFLLVDRQFWILNRRLNLVQEALGKIEARQLAGEGSTDLHEREFRVYSQWGEDGIIQFLCAHVPVKRKIFVEFGVEKYEEANTRFLLVNDNWSGLVIDGSAENVRQIRKGREYWVYNLKAVAAFVTRENINELLEENGVTGEIGLLSIDIDGMDYWVWNAINVITPAIVIVEYNHLFGSEEAVTVPYDPNFERRKAHHSILYYGASLKALCRLANEKGYAFVGCNSTGLNAFFVRRDLKPDVIREFTAEEGFVDAKFCEAHDEHGNRVEMSKEEQRRIVRSLPLVHVDGSASEREAVNRVMHE